MVRAECQAVRAAVGLYETTNYGKYEISGRGARAWLDRVFACRIPRPGSHGARTHAESRGPDRRRPLHRLPGRGSLPIMGSGFAEEFHLRWFWQAASRQLTCSCARAASTLTGVSIAGPKSRELAAAAGAR